MRAACAFLLAFKILVGASHDSSLIRRHGRLGIISVDAEASFEPLNTSTTTTLGCSEGQVRWGSDCLRSCPDGSFKPMGQQLCQACESTCRTCNLTSERCTSCVGLSMGEWPLLRCVTECPPEWSAIDGGCRRCDNNCRSCAGSITSCTACREEHVLDAGRCLDACPEGKYEKGNECVPCDPSCKTCAGEQCQSCQLPRSLHQGSCIEECPVGYYSSLLGGLKRCSQCYDSCLSCVSSQRNCTSCKAGYMLDDTECRTACLPGKFAQGDVCRSCDASCKTCSGSSSSCTTCAEPKLLSNGSCVAKCPNGQFGKDNRCQPCDASCFTCEDATSCTSCGQLYLLEGRCVKSCPKGTFALDQVCVKCHRTCAACAGHASNCTSCAAEMVLDEGLCAVTCSPGKFKTAEGLCAKCDETCATCEGTRHTCLSCGRPRLMDGSKCLSACPGGKFANFRAHCEACEASCATCSLASSNCTSCPDGEVLDGSTCKLTCPDGKYPDRQVCKDCDPACKTCGVGGGCLTCFGKQILHEERCVVACPAAHFADSNPAVCRPCQGCASCERAADNCTSCLAGDVKDGSRCLASCPKGSFDEDGVCKPCVKPCSQCQGTGDHCLECLEELKMVASDGLCSCPRGGFWAGENCEQCDQSCATCSGAAQNCTACHPMALLQGSSCICPDGTFQAPDGRCAPCDPSCLTCATRKACSSCATPRLLREGHCLCPSGSYSTGATCESCQCPCKECSGSSSNCSACSGLAKLTATASGFTCSCPDTAFLASPLRDDNGCGRCKPCSTAGLCATCRNSPRLCTSCVKNHFLLEESCLKTCPENHLAEQGRCRKLVGAVVSFSSSNAHLGVTCDKICNVTALPEESEAGRWIVEHAGQGAIALRSLRFGSLLNVSGRACWPDHGSAACSNMPDSLQFRAVDDGEGQLGLQHLLSRRYLLLASGIDFSEELEPNAPVPSRAVLQPKIWEESKPSKLLFFGHCAEPIRDPLECKLAAASQGVIRYTQFASWKGDEDFPPFCFYYTKPESDLAVTRLVLNLRADAAPSSYRRYAECSKTRPCLCKKS